MSLIMGQIEAEHSELFTLEFEKIADYAFVYSISSTIIDQSEPNLVKMYVIIRSRMSLIMDLIGPGPVFTNHSQEHSLSLSPRSANLNVTQLLIG